MSQSFKRFVSIASIAFVLAAGFVVPAPAHAAGPKVPFIRLYNPSINNHFYTNSRYEAEAARGVGYRIEGDMGYVFQNPEPGTVAIYRLWNPSARKHFYTTSSSEADGAVRGGFLREGVIGYVPTPGLSGGGITVYRLYNARLFKHFLTTNWLEVQALQKAGYAWEGEMGAGIYPTAGDTPVINTGIDFIPVSSPSIAFNAGEYKTSSFQFQYKGPQVIYPTVTYSNMPAGLTGSVLSTSASGVANNDIFSFSISGILNTGLSTNVQATLQSGTGYSETFNITVTAYGQTAPLSILTTNLPDATVGHVYSTELQAVGGTAPYKWRPLSTTYPSACCVLGLNGENGIFNTQTSSVVGEPAGSYSWVVEVTDAVGSKAVKTIYLTINALRTVTITSPYAGTMYRPGDLVQLGWNKTGNLAVPNTYYFVYLKSTPNQLLGSTTYGSPYTPILFRSSTLAFPYYYFTMPSVTPGQYYIELGYTDENGAPISVSTSSAITVTN